MSQKKQKIYKHLLTTIKLFLLVAIFIGIKAPTQAEAYHASDCSDVYTPLSSFVNDGVANNKDAYVQIMNETGVPWEMLAAIHYRETSFSRSNPSNGYGIFQFTPPPESYPPGPVSNEEFIRQLRYMANKLQDDYVWRGSVPRERRRLQPGEINTVLVKDTLFSYNGRASVYADQSVHFGYNRTTQPYEGSPYVMNRFGCERARMGIITKDYGSIDGTDTRYGAFTVYARLRGGNDNYWRTLWSPYAWSIDNFTYSGGDNMIVQNQNETLTLSARNTGKNPWYDHGSCPVRLGTWGSGRNSSFAHNSWLSASKITTVQPSVVLPGEVGTFTFQVSPSQLGTFVEGFNLVVENCQWMPWPGFSPTINVTKAHNWQIDNVIYTNGTGSMNPGETQEIRVHVTNKGSTTWSKSSAPVWLATWQPDRPSLVGISPNSSKWPSNTRVTQANDDNVAPGGQTVFVFPVRMPASGIYYERLNLVSEGVAWFSDPGLTLYLQGKSYAWQPVWVSPSTGNWSIPRNTTFTITIRARNTGTMTWTKNGNFPIRLGTDPPGRGTALETPSWINSIRPAGLVEDSVPPGGEGTFTFLAKTPNVTGMRYEAFNLVAEGILWFQNPAFAININVQ